MWLLPPTASSSCTRIRQDPQAPARSCLDSPVNYFRVACRAGPHRAKPNPRVGCQPSIPATREPLQRLLAAAFWRVASHTCTSSSPAHHSSPPPPTTTPPSSTAIGQHCAQRPPAQCSRQLRRRRERLTLLSALRRRNPLSSSKHLALPPTRTTLA